MFQIIKIKSISIRSLLLTLVIAFSLFFIMITTDIFNDANTIFLLMQIVFVPLFSILLLFLFYDLFGTCHTAFLHTFYKGKIDKIFLVFFSMYSILLLVLCLLMKLTYSNIDVLAAFVLLLSQILLFGSVFLIIFIICSDTSITLALIVLYISYELATFGTSKFLYHVFYFNLHAPVNFFNMVDLLAINLFIGLISYRLFKSIVS